MGQKPTNNTEHKKKAVKQYPTHKDAREHEGAGKYPNYWSYKTRSGHVLMFDDSKDNESITLQHRGGSAIQFHPDGGVQMTSHNGKYDVVFGENRVTITGANDMTVKGDGTLLVYGDLHHTIHGNYNKTVTGSFNMTCDNHNVVIRGNHDVAVQGDQTNKVGHSSVHQIGGSFAVAAKDDAGIAAGKTTTIGGSQGLGLKSGRDIVAHADGNFHQEAQEWHVEAQSKYLEGKGEVHFQGQTVKIHGSRIQIAEGATSPKKGKINSTKTAAFGGSKTGSTSHLA